MQRTKDIQNDFIIVAWCGTVALWYYGSVVVWYHRGVLLGIFSLYFLVVCSTAGRGPGGGRDIIIAGVLGPAPGGPACTGLTTLPIVSLSVKVISAQTTSDMRKK